MLPTLSSVLQYAADRGYLWIPQDGENASCIFQYEILMPLSKADSKVLPHVPSVEAIRKEFSIDINAIADIRRSSILICTAQFNAKGGSIYVRFHASSRDMRLGFWWDHRRVCIPAWTVASRGPLSKKEIVHGIWIQAYGGSVPTNG